MASSSAAVPAGPIEFAKAEFIADVGSFMAGRPVDVTIKDLQDKLAKYKLLEAQILQRKTRLVLKLPEIQKALDAVVMLQEKSGSGDVITADFELTDGVYAKAQMQDVDTVNLWLGAGVMVEYGLDEARAMLEKNLGNCKANIATHSSDLELLKDNITITEVSIARVFNWDVERRRQAKAAGGGEEGEEGEAA